MTDEVIKNRITEEKEDFAEIVRFLSIESKNGVYEVEVVLTTNDEGGFPFRFNFSFENFPHLPDIWKELLSKIFS